MTASGPVVYGSIQNYMDIADKQVGDVAANTKLEIGLVYQDGSNGWKNTSTDGSIPASKIYWNDKIIDNSTGIKGKKTGTFYGGSSIVTGKADGAIPIKSKCRPSNTAAHEGQFKLLTPRTDNIANYSADSAQFIAIYLGHVGESIQINNDCTDAADAETNVQFLIVRGN